MKIQTNEIYERYYSVVAGRFYTAEEKSRLLALFAIGYGIAEDTREFSELCKTVEATERLAIESLVDCNNFLLIADSIPGRREIVKAVRAQKLYLEKAKAASVPVYYNLLDWRTDVFRRRNDDISAKLEAAYIDYARGAVDAAIKGFEYVAERTCELAVIEHLAHIYRERGDLSSSLVKLLVLDEVVKSVIGIDSAEVVRRLIAETKEQLGEEASALASIAASEAVKKIFSYGAVSRNTIGFRR